MNYVIIWEKIVKVKVFGFILLISFVLGLTGCGTKYPELEKDAVGFKMSSYIDETDDDAEYSAIEYNGRTYIAYGTAKGTVNGKNLDKCVGYVVQDENVTSIPDENNTDTRIYALTEDNENNFLMADYIGTDLMNPKTFYRAIDTKGKDINIPRFIESLGYNYWK